MPEQPEATEVRGVPRQGPDLSRGRHRCACGQERVGRMLEEHEANDGTKCQGPVTFIPAGEEEGNSITGSQGLFSVARVRPAPLCDSQVAVSLAFEVIEAKIQHARRQECEGAYQQALADVLRIMAHHRSKIGIGRVDEDEEERGPSGLATEWTA